MNIKVKNKVAFGLMFFLLITLGCSDHKTNDFPLTEREMIENRAYGMLLEYAIFDNTKTDIVKSVLCDSLEANPDIVFRKTETIFPSDTLLMFVSFDKDNFNSSIDWKNVLNVKLEMQDSITWLSVRYHINEITAIIDSIIKSSDNNVDWVLKQRKIKDIYVPTFAFVVKVETYNCKNDFIENVIKLNKQANKLMDRVSKKYYPEEKITIRPIIEIKT